MYDRESTTRIINQLPIIIYKYEENIEVLITKPKYEREDSWILFNCHYLYTNWKRWWAKVRQLSGLKNINSSSSLIDDNDSDQEKGRTVQKISKKIGISQGIYERTKNDN